MEAFGRGLVVEPYLATVVLGGGACGGPAAVRSRPHGCRDIAAGELLAAFAQAEPGWRYELADVVTVARQEGGGWALRAQGVVLHGDAAGLLVATARCSGGRRDRDGVGLFTVDATAPGVTRRPYPTQDGLRAADIHVDHVPASRLGDPPTGWRRPSGWWTRRSPRWPPRRSG